jgi:hypothetical protein
VIAIDVSNDVDRTREFYDQYGFTIPAAFDVNQVGAGMFGVTGTPTNYLLDAQGRIVWRHYGFRRGEEAEVRRQVEQVLASSASN